MTMSRNSDASGAGDNKNIDRPASVTSNTKLTLNEEAVKDLLNEACQGTNFRLGNDAIMLVAELANYLVTETCHRAAKSAIQEGLDQITIDHVEKCMPHIILDFP